MGSWPEQGDPARVASTVQHQPAVTSTPAVRTATGDTVMGTTSPAQP